MIYTLRGLHTLYTEGLAYIDGGVECQNVQSKNGSSIINFTSADEIKFAAGDVLNLPYYIMTMSLTEISTTLCTWKSTLPGTGVFRVYKISNSETTVVQEWASDRNTTRVAYVSGDGSFLSGVGRFTTISDERLKMDIQDASSLARREALSVPEVQTQERPSRKGTPWSGCSRNGAGFPWIGPGGGRRDEVNRSKHSANEVREMSSRGDAQN
jgi:hypothetical protein